MFGERNYKACEACIRKGPNKEDGNAVTFGTTLTLSQARYSRFGNESFKTYSRKQKFYLLLDHDLGLVATQEVIIPVSQ